MTFNFNRKEKEKDLYLNNTAESQLATIYLIMNKKTFGFRYSAEIVGGRGKLERLIGDGKIRAEKVSDSQNGKWQCNAADVLRHAVVKYKKSTKKRQDKK